MLTVVRLSRRRCLCCAFSLLLTLSLLTAPVKPYRAKASTPHPVVKLYCEENSTVGTVSPGILESWCAVVLDVDGTPIVGAHVQFVLDQFSTGATFSFSGGGTYANAQANGCGQASAAATGQSPTGSGYCRIRAFYTDDDLSSPAEGTFALHTANCANNTTADPALAGYPPYKDANNNPMNCGLTYKISTTHIASACQAGVNTWNTSTYAKFVSGTGQTNLDFIDFIDITDPAYARAPSSSTNFRAVKINLYTVDPCPRNPQQSMGADSYYPPASARHHLKSTAAHEIGHCLGLDHNTVDNGALLWKGITVYFQCDVEDPTPDERQGLVNLGYTIPCP